MKFYKRKFHGDNVLNILCPILKYSGLWIPLEKCLSMRALYRIYGIVFQFFLGIVLTISLVGGVLNADNFEAIMALLPITVAEIALMPKIVQIFFFNRHLQKIKESVENMDLLSLEEERFAQIHVDFYRNIAYLFSIFPNLSAFGWAISSITSKDRRLIFDAWCPGFNWRNSDKAYWLVETYQFVAILATANYNIAIDMYYCFAMYVISIKLKLLGTRFSSIQEIKSFPSLKLYLIDHIRTLNHIKSSINEVKYCMSWSYVAQVLMSVLCICSVTNELAHVCEYCFYRLLAIATFL